MTIDKEELADFIIERLNEFAETDPDAVRALVNARVPCNEALARHPTVQVSYRGDGKPLVGLLGILNGIVGTVGKGTFKDCGFVAAEIEDEPATPIRFRKLE